MASGYVQKIREKIGHDPLFFVGAGIIPYRNGQVLLQRRADNGLWAVHGGAVEPGENVEDAARREFYEETGLTAGELILYGIFSGEEYHCFYPNGDEAYMVCIEYLCTDFSGEPTLETSEVMELAWFPLSHIPKNLSPIDALLLNDLEARVTQTLKKEARTYG